MLRTIAIEICLAAVLVFWTTGCSDICSSERISTLKINASKYLLYFNRKNCGATTRYVYELFIASSANNDTELILRFDDGGSENWPTDENKLARITVLAPGDLEVKVAVPVRVFKERKSALGLQVHYDYRPGTKIM